MAEKITIRERVRSLRPGQIIWPIVIVLVFLGIIIGIVNYQKDIAANRVPTVEVSKPETDTTVTDAQIVITGKTEAGNTVTVNDKQVNVDKDGNFSAEVPLSAGFNTITIVTTSKNGKTTIVTRRITREVPVAKTPTTVPKSVSGTTKLNNSGPENFWIPEAALVSAAVIGYLMTRQKLAKAKQRN